MSMQSEPDSPAAAPPGESESSAPGGWLQSEQQSSLTAEMRGLIHQLRETNVHLLVLADQTARCLEHISVLVDLLASSDDADDESQPGAYLDGTPIA